MDSLKQYDTAKIQVDELRLSTKPKDKVVIWVEGNDWRLYRRFFNTDIVEPQGRTGGHSCCSVVDSYNEFKRQDPTRLAIVIRDADFIRANGIALDDCLDIFYADCHDHEMMCIRQEEVRRALLDNFMLGDQIDSFYTKIFDDLLLLSYFQWYNFNNCCCYNFNTLGDLSDFDEVFFKDLSKIEDTVFNRSISRRKKNGVTDSLEHIRLEDIAAFISSHKETDLYEITNGHIFYSRINYYLQKVSKKYSRNEEELKDSIYTAFYFVFKNTHLYARLNEWCIRNNTHILKDLS